MKKALNNVIQKLETGPLDFNDVDAVLRQFNRQGGPLYAPKKIEEVVRLLLDNTVPEDLMNATNSAIFFTLTDNEEMQAYLLDKLVEGINNYKDPDTKWPLQVIRQTLGNNYLSADKSVLVAKGLEVQSRAPNKYKFELARELLDYAAEGSELRSQILQSMYDGAQYLPNDRQNYAYDKIWRKASRSTEIGLQAYYKAADAIPYLNKDSRHTAVMNIAMNGKDYPDLTIRVLEMAIDALPYQMWNMASNSRDILEFAPPATPFFSKALKLAYDNIGADKHTSIIHCILSFCKIVPKDSELYQLALRNALDILPETQDEKNRFDQAISIRNMADPISRTSIRALQIAFEAASSLPAYSQKAAFEQVYEATPRKSDLYKQVRKTLDAFSTVASPAQPEMTTETKPTVVKKPRGVSIDSFLKQAERVISQPR